MLGKGKLCLPWNTMGCARGCCCLVLNIGTGRRRHLPCKVQIDGCVLYSSSGQSLTNSTSAVISLLGQDAARCDNASKDSGGAEHLPGALLSARTSTQEDKHSFPFCSFPLQLWRHLFILMVPLRSNWPCLLTPESHRSEQSNISTLKRDKRTLKKTSQKTRRGHQLLFYIYFSFKQRVAILSSPHNEVNRFIHQVFQI